MSYSSTRHYSTTESYLPYLNPSKRLSAPVDLRREKDWALNNLDQDSQIRESTLGTKSTKATNQTKYQNMFAANPFQKANSLVYIYTSSKIHSTPFNTMHNREGRKSQNPTLECENDQLAVSFTETIDTTYMKTSTTSYSNPFRLRSSGLQSAALQSTNYKLLSPMNNMADDNSMRTQESETEPYITEGLTDKPYGGYSKMSPQTKMNASKHSSTEYRESRVHQRSFQPKKVYGGSLPDQRSDNNTCFTDPSLGGRTSIEIKYNLPEWYTESDDKYLYENSCLVNAVRNTNFRHLRTASASPERKTEKLNLSQQIPQRNSSDKFIPNLSQKLDPPRRATQIDKHIPKVILFVTKYRSGELENDEENEGETDHAAYGPYNKSLRDLNPSDPDPLSRVPLQKCNFDFIEREEDEGLAQMVHILEK